jgi:peroxiredoxin
MRRVAFISFATAILALGCQDQVVLRSADGTGLLRYDCKYIRPQARTGSDIKGLQVMAARIVQHGIENGTLSDVQALVDADEREDYSELERLVVSHLCSGGELVPQGELRSKTVWGAAFPVPGRENAGEGAPKLGEIVPNLQLPILDEAYIQGHLSPTPVFSPQDRFVILTFWASWCGPCNLERLSLTEFWRSYRESGLGVLGILFDDSPSKVLRHLTARQDAGFPILVDKDYTAQGFFSVKSLPQTFLLGPDQRILAHWSGWRDGSEIEVEETLRQYLGNPIG